MIILTCEGERAVDPRDLIHFDLGEIVGRYVQALAVLVTGEQIGVIAFGKMLSGVWHPQATDFDAVSGEVPERVHRA